MFWVVNIDNVKGEKCLLVCDHRNPPFFFVLCYFWLFRPLSRVQVLSIVQMSGAPI